LLFRFGNNNNVSLALPALTRQLTGGMFGKSLETELTSEQSVGERGVELQYTDVVTMTLKWTEFADEIDLMAR
jgi:hypothetical protein